MRKPCCPGSSATPPAVAARCRCRPFAVPGGPRPLLVLLQRRMRQAGEIPHGLPIFLDSPMAIQATELYHRKHRRLL